MSGLIVAMAAIDFLAGVFVGALFVAWLWWRRSGKHGYMPVGSYVGKTPEDAEFARQVDRERAAYRAGQAS